MPSSTRYCSLDHWRGIACLFVVIAHTLPGSAWSQLRGTLGFAPDFGQIGVGIFFAISGYCITAAVWSSWKRGDGFAAFMRRRFRRIYPPYWLATALVMGISFLAFRSYLPLVYKEVPTHWTPWELIGNLTLTETWRPNLGGPPANLYLGQAWTLCMEEQFYLVCGLLLLLPKRFYLVATAALCVATAVVATENQFDWLNVKGIFLDAHWAGFASGVFLFYAIHGIRLENWLSLSALLIGLAATAVIPPNGPFLHERAAVVFSVVAFFLHRYDARIAAARWLQPLAWTGTISYSLYLTHVAICFPSRDWQNTQELTSLEAILCLAATTAACLALAWPFHVFCERPFMSTTQRKAEDQVLHPVATQEA